MCLATHGHDLRFAFSPDVADRVAAARQAMALIERYRAEETALSATYAAEAARRIDLSEMRSAWTHACAKMWPLATPAKRKVAQALAQVGGASGTVDPAHRFAKAGCNARPSRADRCPGASVPRVSPAGWARRRTALALDGAIARADRLRAAIAAEADGPEMLIELRRVTSSLVVDANEMLANDGAIAIADRSIAPCVGSVEPSV